MRLMRSVVTRVVFLIIALSLTTMSCDILSSTGGCCRICTRGKPCGDSCIARNKVCRRGSGCACSGDQLNFSLDICDTGNLAVSFD